MDLIGAFGQSAYVAALANAIQIASGVAACVAWWHLSCHESGCFRHGRLEFEGHHYCRKHHPDRKVITIGRWPGRAQPWVAPRPPKPLPPEHIEKGV